MAAKKSTSNNPDGEAKREPMRLDRSDVNRLTIILVGTVLLAAAIITPWWTRGVTVDWDDDENPRPEGSPIEGYYVQYRPFATPGSIGGFSTDGARETATAILGVGLVLTGLFAALASLSRVAMRFEWIERNPDLPVRFAITATLLGTFTVLWGAFFLPLAGPNPGWLYGAEGEPAEFDEEFGDEGGDFIESTRFANVGFFLGLVGAVAFPAFLWVDAAHARVLAGYGTAKNWTVDFA